MINQLIHDFSSTLQLVVIIAAMVLKLHLKLLLLTQILQLIQPIL